MAGILKPILQPNPWIPHAPTSRQKYFLDLDCEEAMYGGSVGGGKSDALLMWALEGVDIPGYAALIVRRTYRQLSQPGGLIERSQQWLAGTAARWNGSDHCWRFPSGAMLQFGHIQHSNDVYNYQGGEYIRIAFDELTQFLPFQYTYLMSRLRRSQDFPIRPGVRSGSNPGGIGHLWVLKRFISDEAKDGLLSGDYNNIYWSEGRAFVPSRLQDNPYLDKEDYEKKLQHLPPLERQRLMAGDWTVVEDSILRAEWLRYYDMRGDLLVPLDKENKPIGNFDCRQATRICTVDTAGTSKQLAEEKKREQASWSVCGVWDCVRAGNATWLFLRHVWRAQVAFTGLLEGLRNVNKEWRPHKMHIENAHFGPAVFDVLKNEFQCELLSTATRNKSGEGGKPGKVERSTELQLKLSRGEVFLPKHNNDWKPDLESEWLSWTGQEDEQADQVDMASYAAIVAGVQNQSWGGPISMKR